MFRFIHLTTLSILLFISFSLSGSTVDSLLSFLDKSKAKDRPLILNDIAWESFISRELDKSLDYANKAITSSKKNNDRVQHVRALITIATVYSYKGNNSKASEYTQRAIEGSKDTDYQNLGKAYNLLGIINNEKEDYIKSIFYYEKALKYLEIAKDTLYMSKVLNNIALNYSSREIFNLAIKYGLKAIKLKIDQKDLIGLALSYINIGNTYFLKSDPNLAIKYYHKALYVSTQINFIAVISNSNMLLANQHSELKNYDSALYYYEQALLLSEGSNNIVDQAGIYSQIADCYSSMNDFFHSIDNLKIALDLRNEQHDTINANEIRIDIGDEYLNLKKWQESVEWYKSALQEASEIDNSEQIARSLYALCKSYRMSKDYNIAIKYADKCILVCNTDSLYRISKDAHYNLHLVYLALGNYNQALSSYKVFDSLSDKILNEALIDNLTTIDLSEKEERRDFQREFDDFKKIQALTISNQKERNKKQKVILNSLIAGVFLILVVMFLVINNLQRKKKDKKLIEDEKQKVEDLLMNMLPLKVVDDLKNTGVSYPERFEEVSIFFSDIVGFTSISSKLDPVELIDELNEMYTAFDDIMSKHYCERIKTIGDAYMAVCGMPVRNSNHAENLINASLDIIEFMKSRNSSTEIKWEVRIGIHSGKVVGGIVGVRKYLYDVFGDSVNIASRMESSSETMRINISESTYEFVKDKFVCSPRGNLVVKGKGEMKMYYIEDVKNKVLKG